MILIFAPRIFFNTCGPSTSVLPGPVAPITSSVLNTSLKFFTGASRRRIGALERAHRGVIFFDEVADLPLDAQNVLVTAIEGEIERHGGNDPISVELLVIAATNQDLWALVQAGRRAGDLVARYGGEEFVVLLPNTGGPDASETARRLQQEIWSLALPHAETPAGIVTVSLGVASLVPSTRHSPDDLLQQADMALYGAKQAGRNCLRLAAG